MSITNYNKALFWYFSKDYHAPTYEGSGAEKRLVVESKIGDRSGKVFQGTCLKGDGTKIINLSSLYSSGDTVEISFDWKATTDPVAGSSTFNNYWKVPFPLTFSGISGASEFNSSNGQLTLSSDTYYKVIRVKVNSSLKAVYLCEEASETKLHNSLNNQHHLTIDAQLWGTHKKAPYSFNNQNGYSLTGNQIIPVSIADSTKDAIGNNLTHIGRVKQKLYIVSNYCFISNNNWYFEGEFNTAPTLIKVNGVDSTSNFTITNISGNKYKILPNKPKADNFKVFNMGIDGEVFPVSEGHNNTVVSLSGKVLKLVNNEAADWGRQDVFAHNFQMGFSRRPAIDFTKSLENHFNTRNLMSNPVLPVAESLTTSAGRYYSYLINVSTSNGNSFSHQFLIPKTSDSNSSEYVPTGGKASGIYKDSDGVYIRINSNPGYAGGILYLGAFSVFNSEIELKIETNSVSKILAIDDSFSLEVDSKVKSFKDTPNDPAGILSLSSSYLNGNLLTTGVNDWYINAQTPAAAKQELDALIADGYRGKTWSQIYPQFVTKGRVTQNLQFASEIKIETLNQLVTINKNELTHYFDSLSNQNLTAPQNGLSLKKVTTVAVQTLPSASPAYIDFYLGKIQDKNSFVVTQQPDVFGSDSSRSIAPCEASIEFCDCPEHNYFNLSTDRRYKLDKLYSLPSGIKIFENETYINNIIGYHNG